jgi:hypothetical protein
VPSAVKKDKELSSKGLVTILMERQGADEAALEGFLWMKFPDCDAFACVNGAVPTPSSGGLPNGALIGVDGTLLWWGNPIRDAKKVEELIAVELDKVKKGWGDTAEARKVRQALYGKSNFAAALAVVQAMPEGEARTALQLEIDSCHASRKKSVTALQEDGRWDRAHDLAKELVKGVGRHEPWASEAAELLATFTTDNGKAELSLDGKLAKVVKPLRDGNGEGAPKRLEAFLKGAEGTKVGARAQRILTALRTNL